MNTQRLRRTAVGLGRASLGCLMAATCGGAYGDSATMPPPHWFVSGNTPAAAQRQYRSAIDRSTPYEGSGSGLLKSISESAQSGTLMQVSSAAPYLGKSLKMRAFLRSDAVNGRAGLWVRADDVNGLTVAFRNCFNPLAPQSFIEGSTDWKEVEISIEIPDDAVALSYGVQMVGTGTVWIDNVSFNVMGPYVPAQADPVYPTPHPHSDAQKLSSMPQNLDFEQ